MPEWAGIVVFHCSGALLCPTRTAAGYLVRLIPPSRTLNPCCSQSKSYIIQGKARHKEHWPRGVGMNHALRKVLCAGNIQFCAVTINRVMHKKRIPGFHWVYAHFIEYILIFIFIKRAIRKYLQPVSLTREPWPVWTFSLESMSIGLQSTCQSEQA